MRVNVDDLVAYSDWAQIATLLRLHGLNVEPHDFLISP